ncbi:MAG: FkbM family methyltransferase [Pseudomonadota bacterium]
MSAKDDQHPPPEATDPFGTHAPKGFQKAALGLLGRLPPGPVSRRTALLTRRLAGARAPGVFDVEPFPQVRARLHPSDNRCERWALTTPQLWDRLERIALEHAIRAHQSAETARPFVFVDVGANVGLYSLWALSCARRLGHALQALAIEPAPEALRRLRTNLALSEAEADIAVAPNAVAARAGPVRLASHDGNQGETRIGADLPDDAPNQALVAAVHAAPLADLVAATGLPTIDAMKIDIEGDERQALSAYFEAAPETHWPRLLIVEALEGTAPRGEAPFGDQGYRLVDRARLNLVLARQN